VQKHFQSRNTPAYYKLRPKKVLYNLPQMMPLEAVGEMCSYISLVAQEKVEKMNF
jgi:hypothetical protein